MSKNLTFIVELEFSEKVTTDEEILEVAQNIVDALKNQADTAGLAPDDGDAFTTIIRVKPNYLDKTLIQNL